MTLRKIPQPGTLGLVRDFLVALADGLNRVGFVKWFAEGIASQMSGFSPLNAMLVLLLINFFAHYMFASATAHVTALIPVLLAVDPAYPA